VTRAADEALIEELRSAAQVITNDSGPMHVAAFLGCRTVALVRTSPIEEWAPPATQIVRAPATPRGYRPNRRYMSDDILPGWPPVAEIVAALRRAASLTTTT
jgi:ADP-heptose:LPS heptosyltransferase